MTNRILEISDTGAYIRLNNSLIEVIIGEKEKHTIPAEEVGVLLLSNPAVSITQPAMVSIIESGGMIVLCDKRYLPAGMLLPIGTHTIAARNYETQINASEPMKKQIWKEIIQKKILFQSELLTYVHGNDRGLKGMVKRVQSGDTGNMEGVAAKTYWKYLFGEGFKRDQDGLDQNRFLNYGYTILRACAARAICSAGLHPSFGVHHHNQYDAFRLADDIMEPFRPMVDRKAVELLDDFDAYEEMTKEIKKKILEILTGSVRLKKKNVSIFEALTACANSILDAYEETSLKERKKIALPKTLIID